MGEFLEKTLRSLLEFFNTLETSRKIGMIAVTCFIVSGMAGMVIWASKTRYEILYKDLNQEDAKKIAVLLEEEKIAYQFDDDGKSIRVPKDLIEMWRLKLATKGVDFSGTVGYEVFDNQSFGTTSFVQKVNKQRALEGELIKTIKYINGIKRARVHLSIPESSPFVQEKKPPSASVIIELGRGVKLTAQEIKGIGSLVSSAVDGMRPENVVIVNNRGKKLSDNVGDPMTQYTANRMALEGKMNRQFESQIEEILSKVVGNGKVVAKVSVLMDFTQSVSTKTQFDGENKAVLSEVKNSQKLDGRRPSPQGIPGARSNLPGETPQPGIPETSNKVNKELSTRNYNVPSTVTKEKKPTAGLKKITAAVMLDGRRVPKVDAEGNPVLKDGKQQFQYEKWAEADLENFKAIVASTIGLDENRGDKITIKNMEFIKEDLDGIESLLREKANRELIRNIVMYLAIGLTITLFFFLVVKPFIQWVTDNTVESVEDFLPKTLEELEKVQSQQKLPGLEDALPQIEEKLNPEKIEGNMLREKIISLVEANPSKAAQVVHGMIHSTASDKAIA